MNLDVFAFRTNHTGNSKMKKKNKVLSVILFAITFIFIGIYFVGCKTHKTMIDNTVVKELDIQKYLGPGMKLHATTMVLNEDL